MEMEAETLCRSHFEDGSVNPEWLELRKTGVTATDTARLLTGGSWLDLWARKTGKVERENLDTDERVHWGHLMEPVILQAYASPRYANRVVEPSGELMRNLEHPYMLATLDARTLIKMAGEYEWAPLDAKNTDKYLEWRWDEGTPPNIVWQIRHQAIVEGVEVASVAVAVGGNRLMWADEEVTPAHRKQILAVAQEFWWHVENDVPPDKPDSLPETRRALNAVYHPDPDQLAELDETFLDLDEEYATIKRNFDCLKEDFKPVEARLNDIKARFRLAMKDKGRAELSNGSVWTLKPVVTEPHMTKGSSYTRVHRKGPKR